MKQILTILFLFVAVVSFTQSRTVPSLYDNGQFGKKLTLNSFVAKPRLLITTGGGTDSIDMAVISGVAGSYTNSNITVDQWGRVTVASSGGSGGSSWNLAGNAGTNSATNFVGTTDTAKLFFKVNSKKVMQLDSNLKVGIGTSTPVGKLSVAGGGGNNFVTGAIGYFANDSLPASTDVVSVIVSKNGVEALAFGINKNSVTGSVPSNSTFITTSGSSGTISLGRGNGLSPSTSDIFIAAGGSVGIGTTSPSNKFTVTGTGATTLVTAAAVANLTVMDANTTANIIAAGVARPSTDGIYFGVNKASISGSVPSNSLFITSYNSTSTISIGRGNGGNLNTSDIFINSTGQVGIGTTSQHSTLQDAGSFATAYRAITALRTLDGTDHTINCTSGTFTVTLPTAASITGREYTIVNSGSGTITIGTTSSQTFTNINATPTTLTLAPVGAGAIVSYTVVSNGANWIVTGKVKNE